MYHSKPEGRKQYGKMKIGIVTHRGLVHIKTKQKHPFKNMAIRTGKQESQHMTQVDNLSGEVEFVQSKYVKQILPPDLLTVALTYDDLLAVVSALGREHPTAASIAAQVAVAPVVSTGVDTSVERAKQLFEYIREMPTPGGSKKYTKNYH